MQGRGALQAQFGMRSQSHELERVVVGLAIDQDEIGLHMAIAMVFPVAGEGVVAPSSGHGSVKSQFSKQLRQFCRKSFAMRSFELALVVTLEFAGPLNRPHSGRP